MLDLRYPNQFVDHGATEPLGRWASYDERTSFLPVYEDCTFYAPGLSVCKPFGWLTFIIDASYFHLRPGSDPELFMSRTYFESRLHPNYLDRQN